MEKKCSWCNKELVVDKLIVAEQKFYCPTCLEYLVWSYLDHIESVNIPVHKMATMINFTVDDVVDQVIRTIFKEKNYC